MQQREQLLAGTASIGAVVAQIAALTPEGVEVTAVAVPGGPASTGDAGATGAAAPGAGAGAVGAATTVAIDATGSGAGIDAFVQALTAAGVLVSPTRSADTGGGPVRIQGALGPAVIGTRSAGATPGIAGSAPAGDTTMTTTAPADPAAPTTAPGAGGLNRASITPKTLATVVVLALLALAAGYTQVWQPRAREAAELRQEVAEAEAVLAQARQRLATATETESDPAALQALVAGADAALPATPDLDGLIAANREAMAQALVSEISVTPLEAQVSPIAGVSSIGLQVSIRGEAANVVDYVARLEALPRLVVVEQFSSSVLGGGQVNAQLSLRAFHTATQDAAPALSPAPVDGTATPGAAPSIVTTDPTGATSPTDATAAATATSVPGP